MVYYEDRLIFTFFRYQDSSYILLLEVILNHDYDKSKFLRGIKISEEDIDFESEELEEITYINKDISFRYIDKFISFNEIQNDILNLNPPLVVVGSAGSGKTSVVIEKLRELNGKVLYISLSKYLVENSKEICGDFKNIDFLSFEDFLNRVEKQNREEIDFFSFQNWAYKNGIKEIEKYFEEFRGVITASFENNYLSKDEYLNKGIKQSIFTQNRADVYNIFLKYLDFLENNNFYDTNIKSFELLDRVEKLYDFIVIDEVQDFTNMQIYFISKSLKIDSNFIFSGDSNQIIYSNFFSWSNLKNMLFYTTKENQIKILTQNYRSSKSITDIANKLLKIKQIRFGSLDKESNYLLNTQSNISGQIHFYKKTSQIVKELNSEISNSIKFAIIVFDEASKKQVKKDFNTPLVFTVREAKGLEYENIVLVDFISNKSDKFREITKNINIAMLEGDLNYSRAKDKSDRELDTYKIYINSLYVAITRGLKNLYMLEREYHRVYELFGLIEEKKEKLKVEKSTNEEWKEEAKRLEKLGKIEQANEIKKSDLEENSLNKTKNTKKVDNNFTKNELEELFQIALEENDRELIEELAENSLSKAKNYLRKNPTLNDLEQLVFNSKNPKKIDKDKLFKLAKKENSIEIIEKLATILNFKSAKVYLEKLNNLEFEKALSNQDIVTLKKLVDKGVSLKK